MGRACGPRSGRRHAVAPALAAAAVAMVRRGYFAHTTPGGATTVDRLRETGYVHGGAGATYAAELGVRS